MNSVSNHPKNGLSRGHHTRKIGSHIRTCQIRDISRSKSKYLSRNFKENSIDVVAIQETCTPNKAQSSCREKIHEHSTIGATNHRSY